MAPVGGSTPRPRTRCCHRGAPGAWPPNPEPTPPDILSSRWAGHETAQSWTDEPFHERSQGSGQSSSKGSARAYDARALHRRRTGPSERPCPIRAPPLLVGGDSPVTVQTVGLGILESTASGFGEKKSRSAGHGRLLSRNAPSVAYGVSCRVRQEGVAEGLAPSSPQMVGPPFPPGRDSAQTLFSCASESTRSWSGRPPPAIPLQAGLPIHPARPRDHTAREAMILRRTRILANR